MVPFQDLTQEQLIEIAINPQTPTSVLLDLALQEDIYAVKVLLLDNPRLPAEALNVLADQSSSVILVNKILAHPNVPLEALQKILSNLESTKHIPKPESFEEAFRVLIYQTDSVFSYGALMNTNLPLDILIEGIEPFIGDEYTVDEKSLLFYFLCSPKVPVRYLVEFYDHHLATARVAVAGNAKTPPDILVKLAEDPSDNVREAVIQNLAAPLSITAGYLLRNHENLSAEDKELLVKLVDVELTQMGANVNEWDDIPLSWKLRFIASAYSLQI